MNNWIDLSNVPQRDFGNKKVYDWIKSVGVECKFSCENVLGNLKIVGYEPKTHFLSILYNNEVKPIKTDDFRVGKIRTLIGLRTNKFRVEVGDTFVDDHRNMTIISRRYISDSKGRLFREYQYQCNVCGWTEGWIKENHLLNGSGCACCSKYVIVPFLNDLYTTNPELIKYFKNIEDTHKTTTCNKKKFLMVCPNCGNEQLYSTDDLMNHGFSCRKCSDGVSYGEKFMYSLLKQLKVKFIPQLTHTTFDWCGKYRYDFYLTDYNTIIEVDGSQHYYNKPNSKGKFQSCLINDPIKEILAMENNIKNYIHINCSKSKCEYIKNSIIESGLLNILNITSETIDWNECDKFTSKSFIVEVCNYKNKNPELSTYDMSSVLGISSGTIQKYLQKGAELGICIYNKNFEKICHNKNARLKYYLNVS